jgi:four helix bundle protein
MLRNDDQTQPGPKSRFGLEGFDAYQVALSFYREFRAATRGRRGHVVEQGNKAAESVVLNVAEAHPTTGADRARRFRIAVDEAYECGAALDLLEVRGELRQATLARLRALLDRERAMLFKLSR